MGQDVLCTEDPAMESREDPAMESREVNAAPITPDVVPKAQR